MDNLDQLEIAPAKFAVRGVSLTLGNRIVLDELFFQLERGEVLGILGPNGSGKTSLMKCMTGLWRQDRGTFWLDGDAVSASDRNMRAVTGVVFQDPSLDDQLTALENLQLGGGLFGLSKREATARAHELLTFMELNDRAADRTSTFSGGMRRRLELARALIHNPQILLLDEPTTGLDPLAFERIWQRLLALRKLQGLSIIVNTHRADEAEKCDKLVILDRGHVVACEAPDKLMRRVSGQVIEIVAERPEELAEQIENDFVTTVRVDGDTVELEHHDAHELVPRLVEAYEVGRFKSVSVRRPTLADAFFHLTGHSLSGGPGAEE